MAKRKDKTNNLIKAISIIDYVFAAICFIMAFLLIVGGSIISSLGFIQEAIFSKLALPTDLASGIISGLLIVGAIILVGIGIFYIYLGKAISKRKYWAKIAQIIVAILVHLFSFPIGTAVAVFELYVLLFNKETKTLFSK